MSKYIVDQENSLNIILDSFQKILHVSALWGKIKIGPVTVVSREEDDGSYEGTITVGPISVYIQNGMFELSIRNVCDITGTAGKGMEVTMNKGIEGSLGTIKAGISGLLLHICDANIESEGNIEVQSLKSVMFRAAKKLILKGGYTEVTGSTVVVAGSEVELKGENLKGGFSKGMQLLSGDNTVLHSTQGMVLSAGTGTSFTPAQTGVIRNKCTNFEIDSANIELKQGAGLKSSMARGDEIDRVINGIYNTLKACAAGLKGGTDPGAQAAAAAMEIAIATIMPADLTNMKSNFAKVV